MKGLINRLNDEPEIQKIYFSEAGTWLFDPENQHPIVKTREQVFEEWEQYQLDNAIPEDPIIDLEEENRILKETVEALTQENEKLSAGGDVTSEEWIKEREELNAKISSLQGELQILKNKKIRR